MPFLNSIKRNSGVYLLHIFFIAVIAPMVAGSFLGLSEIILESNGQSFLNQFSRIIGGAIFTPIFGSIFSIPLSLISLLIFKLLMDRDENKLLYFCLIGGFSGAVIHSIYFYIDDSNGIVPFSILLFVGIATGYFLSAIWNDGYVKKKSAT